jgi:hypothetical protein
MTMSASPNWATIAGYCLALVLGLALTLVLACWLTPRRWWRRPTAGTLALVGGGTLAFGALFAAFMPATASRVDGPVPLALPLAAPLTAPLAAAAPAPPKPSTPALRYRVVEDLNLRAAKATGAPRLAVLPAGTLVTRSGAFDGDWWQVRARIRGREVEGWASSLWLRRVDERGARTGIDD